MPSIHDRKWLAGALFCAGYLSIESAAQAAERVLVLEVVVNGHATGRVAQFIDRDGALYGDIGELRALGLVVPLALADTAGPIALAAIPDLRAAVDEGRQTLVITAADAALQPTQLNGAKPDRLTPLTRAQFGALLNYDTTLTYAGHRVSGGALLDLRVFGPFGLLESSGLVSVGRHDGQRGAVRLDTTLTLTEESKLRRWRFGDVVSRALPWTRAVRLGGVQVASDFGLRPDLITYPLPELTSSAAVPSTVNVIVNGINQLSEPVQSGPFVVHTLPVVSGAGTVAVTVVDALGREVLLTLPFYASSALLKPGLASYSAEAGVVREDYGLSSNHYSGWAASQSSRLGVTNWLTLESHAEAARHLALMGGGAAVLVGTLGIANVAMAASTGPRRDGAPASGAMLAGGFQRISRRLSVSVSGAAATSGYRDIAAEHGAAVPKSSLNANLGYQMGRWGNLGLAYNRRVMRAERPVAVPEGEPDPAAATVELVTGSYTVSLAGVSTFYATGFKDLRAGGGYGAAVGLNFALGGRAYASLEAGLDDGGASYSATAAKSAQAQGDFGYRLRVAGGRTPRQSAEGEYLSSWGRLSGGIDHGRGGIAARAGVSGAVVLAGGELYASDRIDDSFAIVDTGDAAGVPVLYENRLVGRTNARGKLLIPSLRSFEDNRLSIDSTLLPADVEVAATMLVIRPGDRAGVSADFGIRRVNAALLTLHDAGGRPLPLGSVARVEGGDDRPVGHDGAAYVTGLKPDNRMTVALPDGSMCAVRFAYRPAAGEIPAIGPLLCR